MTVRSLRFLTGLLHLHRRTHDRRPSQRAGMARTQAKLVLRWFRSGTRVAALGRHAISQATAYRYLHEGIDVLAAHAPQLHETLAAEPGDNGHHLWYSGKHKRFGGNVQVLADPTGFPLWISPIEPGSTRDITAARAHCLRALYQMAAAGLPTLADQGYQGGGIGVHTLIKGANRGVDNRAYNKLLTGMRTIGERANALLTQR